MRIKFFRSKEKKEILRQLNENFGIEELPYLLIETGKEKIRFFSGDLNRDEIKKLASLTTIENIGLYSLREENGLRITLDATHILKDQITKGIIELNDEEAKAWLKGENIQKQTPKGPLIIKNKTDFLGTTKSNGEKLFNYIPKERRLRK